MFIFTDATLLQIVPQLCGLTQRRLWKEQACLFAIQDLAFYGEAKPGWDRIAHGERRLLLLPPTDPTDDHLLPGESPQRGREELWHVHGETTTHHKHKNQKQVSPKKLLKTSKLSSKDETKQRK